MPDAMNNAYMGELAALLVAVCWSISSLSFEAAGKRIGSLQVNFIRLVLAFIFLTLFNGIFRHQFWPQSFSAHAWFWLSLSGLVGFVFGDYFLFNAYVIVGARISMLIMSLVPLITATIGWLFLGEMMSLREILAMLVTISGVVFVIIGRNTENGKLKFSQPVTGILYAFGGAIGQAVGLVLSKYGMGDYNAFGATQIRVITGMIGFALIFLILKRFPLLMKAVNNRSAIKFTTLGAFIGPFLGVSLSLYAVQHTVTGIASTIMAIVPVLIIPIEVLIKKEKVTFREVTGAIVAVGGVALYFIE